MIKNFDIRNFMTYYMFFVSVHFCLWNQCSTNSRCLANDTGYDCICDEGYSGKHCKSKDMILLELLFITLLSIKTTVPYLQHIQYHSTIVYYLVIPYLIIRCRTLRYHTIPNHAMPYVTMRSGPTRTKQLS